MFDTMTLTKTLASLCGALLIFLLFGWAAEVIYHPHGSAGQQAYVIDTGEDPADDVPAEEEVPFAELLAAADPGAGQGLWRQCQACHRLDGTDGTGPHLDGVVDRPKAAVAGFSYSNAALAQQGDAWTPENLSAFLASPRDYMPGTRMSYNGMRNATDRAHLIAYLATTGG
jgi:cytochrome c